MHSKNMTLITSPLKDFRLILMTVFFALLLSACGNSEDAKKVKEALDINQLNISSLELQSPNTVIEFNATEQFIAIAIIGDGSEEPLTVTNKVKWSVSNTNTASINSTGLLNGNEGGLVTITAQLGDLIATKDIHLSTATLSSINIIDNISPVSVCREGYELIAQGIYSDATTRDITDLSTWSSDDVSRLSIDDLGIFSTYKDGTSTVMAVRDNVSATTNITINDDINSVQIKASSDSVYVDRAIEFTASGTYEDSNTINITNMVTWSSSDSDTLSISNDIATKGAATGIATGSANISASCLTTTPVTSNSIEISVSEVPIINDIAIDGDATILEFKIADSPEQLTANLKNSDDAYSTDVSDNEFTTWSINETISGDPVTLSDTGEITFTKVGITEIKVRYYDSDNDLGPFTDTIEIEIVTN